MENINIEQIESQTVDGLKDFQKATVERVSTLFKNGQNRVLVADEVGMGKTLVARGVIAKTARICLEKQQKLFKVVYVCSNQNIAKQNLRKLDINNTVTAESVTDTRLSMQHLRITEQSFDPAILQGFIHLIPLTPETSFKMTSGRGNVNERALMFSILRRMHFVRMYLNELESLLCGGVSSWEWYKKEFDERVSKCKKITNSNYPANVIGKINDYDATYHIKKDLITHLRKIRNNESRNDSQTIHKLRIMFARISVSMLDPDLVIMDEFQRYKKLLDLDENSDLGILVRAFLSGEDTRVLLLSATPYKLYSTLDEIEDSNQVDEHYDEFFNVIDFLFKEKKPDFHEIWGNYSKALKELQHGNISILEIKNKAEDALYNTVCRTERLSVMDMGDYTDNTAVSHLHITEDDVRSYLQMGKLLQLCDADFNLNIDYVKSCPYLMSFMRKYKVKSYVKKYFKDHHEKINKCNKNDLWISRAKIDKYVELPKTNARLELLKEQAFKGALEQLLWIPPSKPYCPMQGVYKNASHISKILVFSSWEMVPRMIGALISYEAERRTIGKLYLQDKQRDRKNAHYFADSKKRYPSPRLKFKALSTEQKGMSLFCLLYPSNTLAKAFDSISCINRQLTLSQIKAEIRKTIKRELAKLNKYIDRSIKRQDEKWYYLAPMLMDGQQKVLEWASSFWYASLFDNVDNSFSETRNDILSPIQKLETYLKDSSLKLGKQPDDLLETLVNMTLGSPAVCIYRSNGQNEIRATELAKIFINIFNSTEATAIVELAYGKKIKDDYHWQNVLRYCRDGCFQAMFDEYYHLMKDSVGLLDDSSKDQVIFELMKQSLNIHTANYVVDTFASFKGSIEGGGERGISMRSNYAVGFTKDVSDDMSNVKRKENVRNAFNSPMRPFVLATTSIGQEGLDFHYYCRKVMHWNLPSNPIDLEQREGRVNRYKCLAIRQNIADLYGHIRFENDIWAELFDVAAREEKKVGQSDLVPYWCLGKNQSVKIERIVPMYPISKDEINYERMIKILSLYRLTLGQARQAELLEYFFDHFENTDELKELFINLSPYDKGISV